MKYDDIPWHDSEKWKKGSWYPLVCNSNWTNKLNVVEGYDIFMLDEDGVDIVPVGPGELMNFKTAVKFCEAHNGWSFGL